ncbi:hypothetical protein DIPPA_18958 [Diplonema papillatum]|nr:hypothetical protein DIPPA_18958 [Diplonema papillatum]
MPWGIDSQGGGRMMASERQVSREEVDMLRREVGVLRDAVSTAEERAGKEERECAAYRNRVMRLQSENTVLHESLREAQSMLEDTIADVPQLQPKVESLQSSMRLGVKAINDLHSALDAAACRSASAEQKLRDLQRQHQELSANTFKLLQATSISPAAEPVLPHGRQEPATDDFVAAHAYLNTLKASLNTLQSQLTDDRRKLAHVSSVPSSPSINVTQPHGNRSRIAPGRIQHVRQTNDVGELKALLEDLLQELSDQRESAAELEASVRMTAHMSPAALDVARGQTDRELLGELWEALLTPEEKVARYRARLTQASADYTNVVEENKRLHKDKERLLMNFNNVQPPVATPQKMQFGSPLMSGHPDHMHMQQVMRELQDYRGEVARLKDEKQRLLDAVKQASSLRKAHSTRGDSKSRRKPGRSGQPLETRFGRESSVESASTSTTGTGTDYSYGSDSSVGGPAKNAGAHKNDKQTTALRQLSDENRKLKDERDKLVDQLIAARASAQAAELLKIDSQDDRRAFQEKLDCARTEIAELQHKNASLCVRPPVADRSTSPEPEAKANLPVDAREDRYEEEGIEVVPLPAAAYQQQEAEKRPQVDEYALASLRHVLEQTQQLLERSDQQLLDEREKGVGFTQQLEDMRVALEKTLREGSELQQQRDALIVERDQWAQAARDADDARRKLVEHIEVLHTSGGQRGDGNTATRPPEVVDLLRDKAELMVQIDILKERLADSMEELEGARRELVGSLDARSELQREQDKNADILNALREVEAARDKIEQENQQLQEEAKDVQNQLDNANLVKKCGSERVEQMKRETDEMKSANEQLRRELEAQMKEIAFLCDTLTETSAQYEDCAQRLEQTDSERNKLLAEKHRDLERIEELSGKLTQVRLQNDKEAQDERKQLQAEREMDALMLAERMKELQDCKVEIIEVKAKATKAINVLKSSLQNALLQMKTLGDEFEEERADMQTRIFELEKNSNEFSAENESLKHQIAAQNKRDGADKLAERVQALSNGLQETKEKFAEQTQAYEKVKAELRSARKQLAENADFKQLFEEANDAMERLTVQGAKLAADNKELRSKLDNWSANAVADQQKEADEVALALRDQIESLQCELKREKDLRFRLREQNERMRHEQDQYEEEMNGLVSDLTKQLEKAGAARRANIRSLVTHLPQNRASLNNTGSTATHTPRGGNAADDGAHPVILDRHSMPDSVHEAGSEGAHGMSMHQDGQFAGASISYLHDLENEPINVQEGTFFALENRISTLQADLEQRNRDVDDLAQELQLQRQESNGVMDDVAGNLNKLKAENEELIRTMRRVETLAMTYGPTPEQHQQFLQQQHQHKDRLPSVSNTHGEPPQDDTPGAKGEAGGGQSVAKARQALQDSTLAAVRTTLEWMQGKVDLSHLSSREEFGASSAEFEQVRMDFTERLRRAEERRVEALDEVNTLRGENDKFRDDCSALRAENLALAELSRSADGYKKASDRLQNELRMMMDERDKLHQELQEAKKEQSSEVSSLIEANELATVALEKMQREVANANAETERLASQKGTTDAVIDGLNKTLAEVRKSLTASEQSVADARREREEANRGRDRALKERSDATSVLDEVRNELVQTKADFARLQAVCQDLDGLNALIDETQDELVQTKEQLEATRGELQRLRATRDADIVKVADEERNKVDETVRQLMKEKEEVVREVDKSIRQKEDAERQALHDRERHRIEIRQAEQERMSLASEAEHQQQLSNDRLREIDDLRHQLLIAQSNAVVVGDQPQTPDQQHHHQAINDEVQRELSRLRAEADRRRTEMDRLAAENSALRSDLAVASSRAQTAAVDDTVLHGQLASNAGDLHSLASQISRQRDEIEKLRRELSDKSAALDEARLALDDAMSSMNQQLTRCQKLQAENSNLQDELVSTKKELEEGRDLMLSLVGPSAFEPPHAPSSQSP